MQDTSHNDTNVRIFVKIVFGGLVIFVIVAITVSIARALPAVMKPAITSPLLNKTDRVLASVDRITASDEEDVLDQLTHKSPSSVISTTSILAKAYYVKDLNTGKVLAEKNSDRLLPIASLAKLVTAAVTRNVYSGDERITIDAKIMNTVGNTAGFRIGETFSVNDLFYPLLMVSSNDAAEALARNYGRTKFIAKMNDFAQSIGAYGTYFADPAGLSPSTVTTAKDLSIIIDWLNKNRPDIIAITRKKETTVRNHTWVNPTHFLNWSDYAGGKNGYIPESDRTAVAIFNIASHNIAIVVLGTSERDQDMVNLLERAKTQIQ